MAAEFTVFKKTYIRDTSKPPIETDSFSALSTNTTYLLRATNGSDADPTLEQVSSALSFLNDTQILFPKEFNQKMTLIEKQITLKTANSISTEIRSIPGGRLSIEIIGNDDQPPVLTWLAPQNNALFEIPPIPSELKLNDDTSGIDPLSLNILLDNISVRDSFPALNGPTLDATLNANLNASHGPHTLLAQAKDIAGNPAQASVSFLVNRKPTANAGADQNVYTRDSVTLDGSASTDPDNDPLTYQWILILKPDTSNASLSGATTTNPSFTPDIEGSYEFQLVVNDGFVDSAPDSIVITATNPGPPTPKPTAQSGFIHGYVFDPRTNLPLKDVTVTIKGIEGIILTNEEGKFSFPTPGTGEFGLTFRKEGYTFVQRKTEVVSTRNSSVDPVYLMPIDPAVTTITNEGGTHISSTGKIKITIPPNSLPQGTESISMRSTLYENSKELPAPLPKTSFFTYCLDLQPDGAQFTQPVSIKFANELGFSPGTQIPIGIYNSETFQWEDSGLKATVSGDGQWAEYQVVHFSKHDTNLPPKVGGGKTSSNVTGINTPENTDKKKPCAKDATKSLILFKSGELIQDHSLPSVKALNQEHNLSLIYNSLNANPKSLISIDTNLDTALTIVPPTTTFKLNIEGINVQKTFKGVSGDARYSYLYDCKNAFGEKLPTGSYPYTIEVFNDYTDITYGTADYFGGPPTGDTGVLTREPVSLSTTIKGRLVVNNLQNSDFGSGWSLSGVQRLYFDPDGPIVVTEDDGSAKIFEKQIKLIQNLAVTNWNSNYISILLGSGDGIFQDQTAYFAGPGPFSICSGDFNQDSFTDLVVGKRFETGISVFLGNGDGTFQGRTHYPTTIRDVYSVSVGDFNQVTFTDLAVANVWTYYVSIFLGNGDGTFKDPVNYYSGYLPHGIVAGDFNRDTFQDLAVTNWWDNFISILLGNGDGTFRYPTTYPVGVHPRAIAAGDFNKDAFLDLAVGNADSNNISILLGNGDGAFKDQVMYTTASNPHSIAIDDFNRDSFIDLVVANAGSDNVSIFLGNGSGIFQNPVNYSAGALPYSVSVGDINQDTFTDLVVVNNLDNNISILLGNGNGTFQDKVNYSVGPAPTDVTVFNVSNVTYPKGAFVPPKGEYSYILQNPDKTYTRFLKDGTKIIFNEQGLLTQTIDKNGNTTTYTYDDFDGDGKEEEPSSIALPTGAQYYFSYDSRGKLSTITDPAGRITKFNIDEKGDLIQITNPDNTTKTYAYDAEHLMTTKTNERGFTTEYLYDNYGLIKEARTPEREVTEVAADGTVTTSRKQETGTYLPSNTKGLINDLPLNVGTPQNPADIVRPEDISETFIDGKGNTETYRTDKFGGRLKFTDPLNNTTIYKRDVNSNLTKLTRANGSTVQMAYDSKGNLTSLKEEYNGAITRIAYEPNFNQPASIEDPKGNLTSIDYDSKGNPVQITDALGNIAKIEFNPKGQPTKVISASGTNIQNETNFSYDPVSFNLLSITDPLGKPTSFTYDVAGNIRTVTDAEGKTTTYSYDSMNRITSATDADSKTTAYAYDPAGNLISITDANNHTTTFAYDEQGQFIKTTNALNQQRQFSYDVNRNLSLIITPNGDNIKFYYNKANIPEKKFAPSDTAGYSYDSLYNLTGASDSDSSLSFVYDPIGRLTQAITNPGFLQPQTSISYAYDLNNNRTSLIASPSGEAISYIYDSLNRLTDIKDQQANTISHFEYDQLSRRINKTFPLPNNQQITTNYTYDLASQLLSIAHQPLSLTYSYTYDDVGNRNTLTDGYGTHNYSYDNLYRLTQAVHPNMPQESYAYDPVGNRLGYVVDAANHLTDDGTYGYSYDNNGNMINKVNKTTGETTQYAYDPENRLTRVIASGSEAIYSYDPLGRRIYKNVNGAIAQYVYDGEDILAEFDSNSVYITIYTHGPGIDEPLTLDKAGQRYYYQTDGLDSVTAITDSNNNIVQFYTYDSFGNIVNTTGSLTQPYTYTGREYDPETGLYYYRARYYDPKIGRFLQEDPVWGVNLYSYVGNSPLNWIDPWGLIWVTTGYDYQGTKNTLIVIIKHFVYAKEGKMIGSDPHHYEGATRDVIQEWQHDPDNPCRDKEYTIGEKRKIRQTYQEKPIPKPDELWDPTTTHYWDTPIPTRTYNSY